jgi:hypothetical protein
MLSLLDIDSGIIKGKIWGDILLKPSNIKDAN